MIELEVADSTAELVWAACRPSPDTAAISRAIDNGADVESVGRWSIGARTAPLLWRALDGSDRLDSLGEARALVAEEYQIRRVQAAVVIPLALAQAAEPLVATGLEPVIFKGPAISRRYPEPGLRPMDDIDILIDPGEHARGIAALENNGWLVLEREGWRHDTLLKHPDVPGLALELHIALGHWRERTTSLTSQDLWRLRVPIECMGTRAFGLPPEHELVALAVHAGKPWHTFGRLIWSVDLAVLIEDERGRIDWDAVSRFSDESGCTTVVAIGLRHARRLGADVPDELLALPASRYRRAALAPLLDSAWPLAQRTGGDVDRLRYALPDKRLLPLARLLLGWHVFRHGPWRAPLHIVRTLAAALRRMYRWRHVEAVIDDD